jgi:methionine biosynthesis protein MetW
VKLSSHKIYDNAGNEDVLSLIPSGAENILDIGCGSGSLARRLVSNECTVDGITISEDELEVASSFLRYGYLHDLEKGLPEEILVNKYNYIICSHILEHVAFPQKLLSDMQKVLAKEGQVIVAIPNLFHYRSRWELLKGRFPYSEQGIWDYTHVRWYSFVSANELLSRFFVVQKSWVTGQLPFNRLFGRIFPAKMSKLIYKLLSGISKGFFGYQMMFVLKSKGQ